MSSLKVTPAQLETLGGTTLRTSGDVRTQHQTLKSQLAPLFGADWSGSAAATFTTLYESFDSHAKGLSDALDGIATLLQRAGAAYASTESQVTSSFR